MRKDKFADVIDDVDLRQVGARVQFVQAETHRVGGLREGQVISYRNRAGTRFRHLQKIDGRVCLVIPPYDPEDKHSMALKESILLEKMSAMRKHREAFQGFIEQTSGRIQRAQERAKRAKKRARQKITTLK